jgi:hypothetical protein
MMPRVSGRLEVREIPEFVDHQLASIVEVDGPYLAAEPAAVELNDCRTVTKVPQIGRAT